MLFYIVFIILQGLLLYIGYITPKKIIKNLCLFASYFIFFFVAAFRFDVGYDYENYYNYVDRKWLWGIIRMEPLNQLIFYAAVFLKSPLFAFTIYAFLTYFFIFKAFKANSINPYLSIFLYALLFYIESLCYLRQAIALGISLYAFQYIKTKNIKKCIIWGIVAILFHFSAIVTFIIYILYHRVNIKTVCIYSIAAILAKNIIFAIMVNLNFYSVYFTRTEISGGSMIRLFYIALIIGLYLLKKKKSIEERKIFTIVFFGLHLPFLFGSHLGMRIANFFFIYICLLIPLYLKRKSSKVIFSSLLICYFTIFLYITSINNKSQYIPYHFYWNKDKVEFRSQKL